MNYNMKKRVYLQMKLGSYLIVCLVFVLYGLLIPQYCSNILQLKLL